MKITSTRASANHAIKALIYGESGIGKTYLASTLNGKTLVISAESGLLSLANFDIDVIDLSVDDTGKPVTKSMKIDRIMEVYKFLLKPESLAKYDNVFIDSLTEIGQNVSEKFKLEFPEKKDALKLWGEYNDKMRSIIKAFRDLPKYNVVMTALVKFDKDDTNCRNALINIQGSIGEHLPQFFDEVFFYGLSVKEDSATSRMLYTSKSDRYIAKDRSGRLKPMEDPDLSGIFLKIKKETKNEQSK